jgi:hypothetical protein
MDFLQFEGLKLLSRDAETGGRARARRAPPPHTGPPLGKRRACSHWRYFFTLMIFRPSCSLRI